MLAPVTVIERPLAQPRIVHDLRGRHKAQSRIRPGDLVITESGIHEVRADMRLWAWKEAA